MASILNTEELEALDDLYFTTHQGESEVQVFNCGRQLDNIGQLAGIPSSSWVSKTPVTCVIARDVRRTVLETFAEPERLDALYRARNLYAGFVAAGDVLREADGTVWLAFQPSEYDNGRPRVRAGLELVPKTMLPAAIRNGATPAQTNEAYMKRHTVYGTFTAGTSTAVFNTSAHPVNALQAASDLWAIWNTTILDDATITIAPDRLSVSVLLGMDALDPASRQTFTTGDGLRLRYLADS